MSLLLNNKLSIVHKNIQPLVVKEEAELEHSNILMSMELSSKLHTLIKPKKDHASRIKDNTNQQALSLKVIPVME